MSTWKEEARQYWEDGMSQRQIAKHLNVPRSTIGDYIRKLGVVPYDSAPVETGQGPKILFIDIETSPIIAHVWRLFDQNVGLNQIEVDWSILSFAAKWKGSDEIIYMDTSDQSDYNDDSCLLDSLWRLLNEADIVVGQNSKRFDVKKINARFVLNGMPKPSSFRQIDTMLIAKAQFSFTSNKLEYMTDKLCVQFKKLTHSKFPGHTLWKECLDGNPEAWEDMRLYNEMDVYSLEELYDILSSWDTTLPNFDVYVDGILDMSEWEEDGYVFSQVGKYQRYRNIRTGVQRRSRVNLLSKEKRQSLLMNIPA